MELKEYRAMPGVKDLPLAVAGLFCLALKAEDAGEHLKAAEYLDRAIEKETEVNKSN